MWLPKGRCADEGSRNLLVFHFLAYAAVCAQWSIHIFILLLLVSLQAHRLTGPLERQLFLETVSVRIYSCCFVMTRKGSR